MSDQADRTTDVYAELDRLQAESETRRAELREIAAELPATMSRRALLRTVGSDLVRAPDKPMIARRALHKLARAPRALVRRFSTRSS